MSDLQSLTVTEAFRRAINERPVLHAFFTTFTFEPDFFELEVLPLLLDESALSSNETIRYAQLQDLMRDHHDRFAVAYDYDMFSQDMAGRLEIEYRPERLAGGCHHAKLAVLEVENGENAPTSLILCAGSFNLTKAGWWENIEVGHWYELRPDHAPDNIITPLLTALSYYARSRPSPVLTALSSRLSQFERTDDDSQVAFYFSYNQSGKKHQPFDQFLLANIPQGKTDIEIISPYFAEDGHNAAMTDFIDHFRHCTLLLPKDEQGNALIDQSVYTGLSANDVAWASWDKELSKRFHVPKHGDIERKLHAKLYHGLAKKPWAFLGSVNFSFKAFRSNVEAGFLLHNVMPHPLLQEDVSPVERFSPPSERASPEQDGGATMPVIQLSFNWLTHELEAIASETGQLRLLDSDSQELARYQLSANTSATQTLLACGAKLQRSALVDALWCDDNGAELAQRKLLVSQKNLYCRPNDLPAFQLQDLLSIYLEVGAERRAEFIAAQAAVMLARETDGMHLDQFVPSIDQAAQASFFSAFSQVNGAFWVLRKKLQEAQQAGNTSMLDYYFIGCQPDSFRGILKALHPADGSAAPVVIGYLTLLSMEQLVELFLPASVEPAIVELKAQIHSSIEQTQRSPEFDEIPNKEKFLTYIRSVFHMSITDLAKRVAQQEN